MRYMKNKKGEIVLRDIIFFILIFSGMIALSSIFVSEMGTTYDNINMTSEFNYDVIGEDNLTETSDVWNEVAIKLDGNLFDFLSGTLTAAKEIVTQVILAPATFSSMIGLILEDVGVNEGLSNILSMILTALLYVLIVFAVISAFLKGGKL